MRVAHILRKYDPSEWGGTETAIERLAGGLRRQGTESVVFAPRLSQPTVVADPLVTAGCAVRRFRAVVPVLGITAERKRQMVAVGGNVLSFDLIPALWREPDIDLIHSHALGRLGATARTVARRRGVPFVLSVHGGAYDLPAAVRHELQRPAAGGWDWGRPLGLLLRARHLFKEADVIVTVNEREANLIRERHPGRWVVVQPHGVPLALFATDHRAAARNAFPAICGRMVLLVPGRIDPVKNQNWLIAQAAELVRRHPDALLVLAGACTHREYAEALEVRILREGLSSSVLLAGRLPPGDPRLVGLFQTARAVVLPSLSETFGLVILEAWAAGVPVISSRTSGALALIEENVNGLLFDLGEPSAFHAAISQLIDQPETSRRWGEAGRIKVATHYDTVVLAARMKRLYAQLIEATHAHRNPA